MKLKSYLHNPLDKGNTQLILEDTISCIPQNDLCSDEDERIHNKFKNKSSFDPKINDPFLEAFFVLVKQVKQEIENHTIRISKVNNLTNEERDALHSLQSSTNSPLYKNPAKKKMNN